MPQVLNIEYCVHMSTIYHILGGALAAHKDDHFEVGHVAGADSLHIAQTGD